MAAPKPMPVVDEAQPYWEAAKLGSYLLQRCIVCGTFLVPPVYDCFNCHAGCENVEWAEASGRGILHTFNVYHRAYHPGFVGDVPYNTAVVELIEGPLVTTRIVGCSNDALVVGMPLQVTFIDHNGSKGIWLPVFTPITDNEKERARREDQSRPG